MAADPAVLGRASRARPERERDRRSDALRTEHLATGSSGDVTGYEITTRRVEAIPIASIDVHASPKELDTLIPALLDEVWTHIKEVGLDQRARNVVIYYDEEVHLEVGIEVPADFAGVGRVVRSSTPAGTAAYTVHRGPYEGLGHAHDALRRWCAENGHLTVGPVWEVYGEWNDDTSKLTTEVFYLIG